MRGINDADETAQELAVLLRGRLCHVNLIPSTRSTSCPTNAPIRPGSNASRTSCAKAASRPRSATRAVSTSTPPAGSCEPRSLQPRRDPHDVAAHSDSFRPRCTT